MSKERGLYKYWIKDRMILFPIFGSLFVCGALQMLSTLSCGTVSVDMKKVREFCFFLQSVSEDAVEEPNTALEAVKEETTNLLQTTNEQLQELLTYWQAKVAEVTANLQPVTPAENSTLPGWIVVYAQPETLEGEVATYGPDSVQSPLFPAGNAIAAHELNISGAQYGVTVQLPAGHTTGRIILRVGAADIAVRSVCSAYSHVQGKEDESERISDTFYTPGITVTDSIAEFTLQAGQTFVIDGGCYPNSLLVTVPAGGTVKAEFVPVSTNGSMLPASNDEQMTMHTQISMRDGAVVFEIPDNVVQKHKYRLANARRVFASASTEPKEKA